MNYIKLSDNSIVISLPAGPITLHIRSLNYYPILKALESGTSDNSVLLLLNEKPIDGLWYAYENNKQLIMYHLDSLLSPSVTNTKGEQTALGKYDIFLGTFPSKDVLLAYFPEYFI